MSEPGPEDLERARLAQSSRAMLEITEHHRERRRRKIDDRIFQAIRDNRMTPELAVASWYEVHALYEWTREIKSLARGKPLKT